MRIEITTHADERRRFLDTETGVETFENHQDGHYAILRPEMEVKIDSSGFDTALSRARWALKNPGLETFDYGRVWAFFKTFIKENW